MMRLSRLRSLAKDLGLRRVFLRALRLIEPGGRSVQLILLGSLMVASTRLAEPILFGRLIDAFGRLSAGSGGSPSGVWTIIILLAAVNAVGVAAGYFVALKADRLVQASRWAVTQRYLQHIMSLSQAFHLRQDAGALARYMMEANNYLYVMWLQLFREHASSIMSIVLMFPIMIYLNATLSVLLIVLVLLFLFTNVYFAIVTDAGQRAAYEVDKEIGSHFHDTVANAMLLQSYGRVDAAILTFHELVGKFLRIQFPVLTKWATAYVLTRAFSALALLAIFITGTYLFETGQTTIGELVTFASFAGIIIVRIEQLTNFCTHLLIYRQIMVNFFTVMDTHDVIPERDDAIELRDVRGAVSFENVSFVHAEGEPLISDMSFEVSPGQTVAIVGGTGAGKTTAMGLLCRFWDPQGGRILIDGTDIRDVTLESLRKAIAIVFQDSPVLHRSLTDNLRLGKHDATPEELDELLDLVDLGNFLAHQGGVREGALGQGGRTISGGERQRLGLARALLKDAPILILDEATSALDSVTEAKIQQLIERRRNRRTSLIIAHRLTTVRQADMILVIDKGRIVERGGFDELARAGGWFSRVVAAQTL